LSNQIQVLEYKCPCCDAGLIFGNETQKLTCEYCDNSFEIETVKAYNESIKQKDDVFDWENIETQKWTQEEQCSMHEFQCPSCGGELITDENTVATFCPYCDNPTIMPSRLSDGLKPDSVIPFQTSKEDAKVAFLQLCKGKKLLPKEFTQENRLERITGIYVPFWLYDCDTDFGGNYKATRVHHWSDQHYNYTKTDHFLLKRSAKATFSGIPMDGSSKMEDTFMESIEPYDYSQLSVFDMAYLSGFFADKYDIPSEKGENRIRQRVETALDDEIQASVPGYTTVIPASKQLHIQHNKARYVLLPVWMLNTRYRDKIYTFAMNGQTGKMTGTFPISGKRTFGWFAGVSAAVTLVLYALQFLLI